VLPERERLQQLARLIGVDVFRERLGEPRTAELNQEALRTLVDERLETITDSLLQEAAASDDVLDPASAEAYLDDRLSVLGNLLNDTQADMIRTAFGEKTAQW
jgi:hypothetical protein